MGEQQCFEGLEEDRTIFRHPKDRDHPYVMVAKASALDKRVSLAARGLLQVMLCMPDDCDFNVRHLAEITGASKDVVMGLLRELVDARYVVRDQHRRQGRFAKARYLVFEQPNSTVSGKSGHGATASGNTVSGKTGHGPTGHGKADTVCSVSESSSCQRELSDTSSGSEYEEEGKAPPPATREIRKEPEREPLVRSFSSEYLKIRGLHLDLPDREIQRIAALEKRWGADAVIAGLRQFLAKTKVKPLRFFLDDFGHLWAPARPQGLPKEIPRRCPACGRPLVFGSGSFTRCRCGKAWDIGAGGKLEEVRKETA